MSDVDAQFLNNMTLMLNERLHLKLQRTEKQNEELEKWIRSEQQRRYMAMEVERRNAECEERRLQREYQQHRLRLEQLQVHLTYRTRTINLCRLAPISIAEPLATRGGQLGDLGSIVISPSVVRGRVNFKKVDSLYSAVTMIWPGALSFAISEVAADWQWV